MELLKKHVEKINTIISQIKTCSNNLSHKQFRFVHGSSHCTRALDKSNATLIDISGLNQIIKIDPTENIALVEPTVSMSQLVDSCLAQNVVPKVVMEFPGITCGGAVKGAALESSSFKFGQFNDTCLEYELILGTGELITANKSENSDIFYGISGSYGTLSVLSLIKLELIPAKTYVRLNFTPTKTETVMESIAAEMQGNSDYLEAIVFDKNHSVLITGELTDTVSHQVHSFSKAWDEWFYLYAQTCAKKQDNTQILVPIKDYLFRYNRGAFWMGKYAFNPIPFNRISRYLLNPVLNTNALFKSLHASGAGQRFFIQDCYIPAVQAQKFLESNLDALGGCRPIWLCPIKSTDKPQKLAPHYSKEPYLIDMGIWGSFQNKQHSIERTHRQFENSVSQAGGRKMLYADSYYTQDEFWNIYDLEWYNKLRNKYHAENIFPQIDQKVLT